MAAVHRFLSRIGRSTSRVVGAACLTIVFVSLTACYRPSSVDQSQAAAHLRQTGAVVESEYSLSPDGRAFAFTFKTAQVRAGALFEWRTGKLLRLPGQQHSFSPDGKKLAGRTEQGIAIIDVGSLQVDHVVPDSAGLYRPVFQPTNEAVLCHTGRGLALVDIKTGRRTSVLEDRDGFRTISSLTFISRDEILLNAMGPVSEERSAYLRVIGLDPVGGMVPYRLKFGGQPEIAYQDVITRQIGQTRAPLGTNSNAAADFVAAYRGEKVLFIGRNELAERQANDNAFRYDVFLIERERVSQLTQLAGLLGRVSVSSDGSTAVFGVLAGRVPGARSGRGIYEPRFIDLKTSRVIDPNLPGRLASDPNLN